MKKYSEREIRILKDLDPVFLEVRFCSLDRALADTYLNKFIIKSNIAKKTNLSKELTFIQDQLDQMELEILMLRKENFRLKQK